MIDLMLYVWRLFLYGLVSLLELILGYAIMKSLQDKWHYSRFWSFFFQSIVVGFIAYNLRYLVYS
jgi:hypothetical protein